MLKYINTQVDANEIEKHCINNVINCEQHDKYIILDINISNEDGYGWIEGEGIVADILPLHEEIKSKNYKFLRLVSAINDEYTGKDPDALNSIIVNRNLTRAQEVFLNFK